MQCKSTRFTTEPLLNFLVFIKIYPACRPAACKKFQQSQLGTERARMTLQKTDNNGNTLSSLKLPVELQTTGALHCQYAHMQPILSRDMTSRLFD